MPKNKLTDLNNALFEQLERLNDEELSKEELEKEINRAKAMEGVAKVIVASAKVTIDAYKAVNRGDARMDEMDDIVTPKTKLIE